MAFLRRLLFAFLFFLVAAQGFAKVAVSEESMNGDAGETFEIKEFFQKILLEKLDGFYIKDFRAIEKIALKPLYNPSLCSWTPALSCVEFSDVAHIVQEDDVSIVELMSEEKERESTIEDGKFFLNNEQTLRLFEYEDEYFSVVQGNRKLESSNDKIVFRTEYDDFMRVLKKVKWDISESQQEPKMMSVLRYEYSNDNITRANKSVELFYSDSDDGKQEQTKELTTIYDENTGLILSNVLEVDGVKALEKKWEYDNLSRIICENVIKYDTEQKEKSEKHKKEYIYTERCAEPDIKIYENDNLRLVTEHTDENIYTTTTYFENNYAISAYYVHGRKEIETVYLNDKVVRRRRFNK